MKTDSYLRLCAWVALCICFFAARSTLGQSPDSLWMYHYGGPDHEMGFDAIEGDPGTYYLVGKTKSYGHGGYDAYILKLDNNGGVIWEKTYGDYLDEQLVSICPAYGGFVTTGYTTTNENSSEIWFLWINDDGDSLWTKTYGGVTSDQGYYIRPTSDQAYISTSRLSVYQWGDQIYLMKLDQSGDTIWAKIYGNPRQDYGQSVLETSDGGYIIAGRSYTSSSPESGDAWVLKTDGNGDTTWTRKYGGNDEDIFYCVLEMDDGYLFAGQTRSFGPGYTNVYVVRTDFSGDTLWTRKYGGAIAQNCYAMFEAANGHYVLCGYTSSFSAHNDVYMLEIDPDGNMIWQENYGIAQADEYMYGCRPTSDGGYIITGWTSYYAGLMNELFALKLGPSSTGIKNPGTSSGLAVSVSPNPFSMQTSIHLDVAEATIVCIEIINSTGDCVQSLIDKKAVHGKLDLLWDASGLAAGLYYCKITSLHGVETRKIIKVK